MKYYCIYLYYISNKWFPAEKLGDEQKGKLARNASLLETTTVNIGKALDCFPTCVVELVR